MECWLARMDSNLEEMKAHQEMMEASQDGCLASRDRSLPTSNGGLLGKIEANKKKMEARASGSI